MLRQAGWGWVMSFLEPGACGTPARTLSKNSYIKLEWWKMAFWNRSNDRPGVLTVEKHQRMIEKQNDRDIVVKFIDRVLEDIDDADRDGVDPRDAWASAERKLRSGRKLIYGYSEYSSTAGLGHI